MKRDAAIDRARGIAIVLVATFHMTRGLVTSGRLENSPALEFADRFAYGCHVQIFFLISGYFLYGRMENWRDFAPRAVNLYYPYLLWSFVSAAIVLAMPGAANHSLHLSAVAMIPVVPIHHYWFMLFLIAAMATLVAIRSRVEIACAALAILNIILTIRGFAGDGDWSAFRLSYWLPFTLLGAVLAKHGFKPKPDFGTFVAALTVSIGSVLLSMWTGIEIRSGAFFFSSLAMCYALYCIAAWVRVGLLSYLGELTLVIYLTHVIFGTAVRTLAFRFWPDAPMLVVTTTGVAASVACPVALYAVAAKLGLNTVLGFDPLLTTKRDLPALTETEPPR